MVSAPPFVDPPVRIRTFNPRVLIAAVFVAGAAAGFAIGYERGASLPPSPEAAARVANTLPRGPLLLTCKPSGGFIPPPRPGAAMAPIFECWKPVP